MATGDKIVNLDDLKTLKDYTDDEIADVKSALSLHLALAYPQATRLTTATDYDTLTSPGNYVVRTNSDAQKMTNAPATLPHLLFVFQPTGSNTAQVAIVYDTDYLKIMTRSKFGRSWTGWKQVIYSDQVDTAISTAITTAIANNIDATLSITGKAADAKATGDGIDFAKIMALNNAYVTFYAKDVTPTFDRDASGNLVVTVPARMRGIIASGNISTSNTTAQVFTLNNNNILVYDDDISTGTERIYVSSDVEVIRTGHKVILIGTTAQNNVYGQWAIYYYLQKTREEIDGKQVPDYYFANNYLQGKVDTIIEKAIDIGKYGFQTFFITDYHWDKNEEKSISLLCYLIKKTGISNVVFGGDYITTHNPTSKAAGYKSLSTFYEHTTPVRKLGETYFVTGNHEQNKPGSGTPAEAQLSQDVAYNIFNKPIFNKVHFIGDTNTFYVDDTASHIRFYCIDCIYNSNIKRQTMKAVMDSFGDVPDGYAVILFSHVGITVVENEGIYSATGLTSEFECIVECAKALNDGEEVTITYEGSQTYTWNYDFRNKARTFICGVVGHQHVDVYWVYDNRFPIIATTCDATELSVQSTPERIAGTISEQAFDVVQIDTTNKLIYCTRIGAGDDRTFSYGSSGAGLITT